MKATYSVCDYRRKARPHLKAVVRWKDGNGKWQTKFFNTKLEAKTFAQQRETELKNQGAEARDFPTWLRVSAERCNARLQAEGKTIEDATEYFLNYLAARKKSCSLDHLYMEFHAAKTAQGVCNQYLCHIKSALTRFRQYLPGKLVSDVTSRDCDEWLASRSFGPTTHKNTRRLLILFFNFARNHGYVEKNPATQTIEMKKIETPVGILKPEELARLLEAADPESLAFVAIGAFAGIRNAEICRLDWKEIDLEEGFIEVTAAKAKTARRRLVKILPVLDAWLRPIAKERGPLFSRKKMNEQMRNLRERADVPDWPHNALRHSYASYHIAHFNNAPELALQMGHANTEMIFAHYRQVVRRSEALRYWNILPTNPDNVLEMATQNAQEPISRHRDKITGQLLPTYAPPMEYQKTRAAYAGIYHVSRTTIALWWRQGRPLDDMEAMAKLRARKYTRTYREYAKTYGVSSETIRRWMRAGWPLDNEEAVKAFIATKKKICKGQFQTAASKAFQIVPLAPATTNADSAASGRQASVA